MSDTPIARITKAKFSPRKIGRLAFEIGMILIAIAFIYPTIYVVINSFKPTAEIQLNPAGFPKSPVLDNYVQVWATEGSGGISFFKALINTLTLTIGSVAGVILLSSMAAYAVVRSTSRWSTVLFFAFAFFFVIPFQTIMVFLVMLVTDLKISSTIGLIPVYIGLGIPTAIFMYHGFIKSVPISLEESAAMDGAGTLRIFFRIVLPMLAPITATITILDILWVWNDFLLPYITMRTGTLVLFQFNFFGTFTKNYGALTASLVMSATPMVILYFAMQRFFIKGIAAGAVKG